MLGVKLRGVLQVLQLMIGLDRMSGRPRCPVGPPAVLSPFIIVMVMAVVVVREAVARAVGGGGDKLIAASGGSGDLDLGGSGSMVVVFFCAIKSSRKSAALPIVQCSRRVKL